MISPDELLELVSGVFENKSLIFATISNPRKNGEISKVTIRPIEIKKKLHYQITENRSKQSVHHNLDKNACLIEIQKYLQLFKQGIFYTKEADYHFLSNKKSHITLLKKKASKVPQPTLHNRKKKYLLEENSSIPFLVELGIMNSDGKVYPAKQDKFRQINRFLEMIDDVLPHLDSSKKITIIDFGCGKAYLTFALFYFMAKVCNYSVRLIGLDLKEDVVQNCEKLAYKLGYQDSLQFICQDINSYDCDVKVDMVVSLHACDTATDAAIEKGIRWNAKIILAVPCCQHELYNQIDQKTLNPLLNHGILRERFASLVTDAARVQLLEILGYHTQILEFIDVEHTPKNLLIRAIKYDIIKQSRATALEAYSAFKSHLNIFPSLEKRFSAELLNMQLR